MKFRTLPGVYLLAVLFSAGCEPVASLHPLFGNDYKEVVFEAELAGTWVTHDGDGKELTIAFVPFPEANPEAYKITFKNLGKGEHLKSLGRLVRLGNYLFLDITADAEAAYNSEVYLPIPALLVHQFLCVALEKDTLQITFLDDEWLSRKIDDGDVDIAHDIVSSDEGPFYTTLDFPILTARTEDLQSLCLKYVADFRPLPEDAKEQWHRQK